MMPMPEDRRRPCVYATTQTSIRANFRRNEGFWSGKIAAPRAYFCPNVATPSQFAGSPAPAKLLQRSR